MITLFQVDAARYFSMWRGRLFLVSDPHFVVPDLRHVTTAMSQLYFTKWSDSAYGRMYGWCGLGTEGQR